MKYKDITILGGGNLGASIAEGLLNSGLVTNETLHVTSREIDRPLHVNITKFKITYDNIPAIKSGRFIFICVQPKQLHILLEEIKNMLDPQKHVLISTVTGVSIETIIQKLGYAMPVFRAMPNTAISIQQSMTCVATNSDNDALKSEIKEIFDKLGKTIFIGEELIASATVLASSGIAFACRYIRAASQGGIEIGFDAEIAKEIAAQTVKGAASLLLEKGDHPEEEIDKVTTPQGVTISGLNEMEHRGFSSALIKGLIVSFNKIRNIMKD